jgi:hypothetical protein
MGQSNDSRAEAALQEWKDTSARSVDDAEKIPRKNPKKTPPTAREREVERILNVLEEQKVSILTAASWLLSIVQEKEYKGLKAKPAKYGADREILEDYIQWHPEYEQHRELMDGLLSHVRSKIWKMLELREQHAADISETE